MSRLNENSIANESNVNSLIGQGLPKEHQGEETPSDTVKLISSDKKEFKIKRKIAYKATALKNLLENPIGSMNEVILKNIPGYYLKIVCEFLSKKEAEKFDEESLVKQLSKEFYTFVNEINASILKAEDSAKEHQKNPTASHVKVISCDGSPTEVLHSKICWMFKMERLMW